MALYMLVLVGEEGTLLGLIGDGKVQVPVVSCSVIRSGAGTLCHGHEVGNHSCIVTVARHVCWWDWFCVA